jgi:SAM-dependent methyltransferase
MSSTESSHVTLREAWEASAEAWSDYVRAGRDPFFHVNLRAFLELLPPPRGTTLDLGCGEGRVGAELARHGHRVLGVELSPTLAARARERHEVVEADASRLPFEDAIFPLVVSFNSLMDMDDAAGAVREAARVLEPGGLFCAAIVHPFLSAGSGEPFTIAGSYLEPTRLRGPLARGDFELETMHRPLSWYFEAVAAAGLVVESLREMPGRNRPHLPISLHLRAVRA